MTSLQRRLLVTEARRLAATRRAVERRCPWWESIAEDALPVAVDCRAVLGVGPGAAQAELQAALLAAAHKLHVSGLATDDGSAFVRARMCYEYLATQHQPVDDATLLLPKSPACALPPSGFLGGWAAARMAAAWAVTAGRSGAASARASAFPVPSLAGPAVALSLL